MNILHKILAAAVICLISCVSALAATHTNTINSANNTFNPKHMTIQAGDTVVWINTAFHTVTGTSEGEAFCGTSEPPGGTCTVTFNNPGTYSYICIPHDFFGMNGTVTVQAAPPPFELKPIERSGNNVNVAWDGGTGPYVLQKREAISEVGWRDLAITANKTVTAGVEGNTGFYRVEDIANLPGIPFSVYLSGALERPNPVNTSGSGFGTLRLVGDTLHFDIRYENLSTNANNAHIHGPASSSEATGVLVNLVPFNGGSFSTNGTIAGSVTLSQSTKLALLSGRTYVNIHTFNHTGGEIRGQIAPVLMHAALSGEAERPPRLSIGQGQSTLFLVGTNLTFNITYKNLMGTANNAHIHAPATTAIGAGVMRDLVAFHDGPLGRAGSFGGTMGLTLPQLTNIIDGLGYINIHSTVYGGGELRGQITPKITAIGLTASLSGAAEKPNPVATPGTGIGTMRLEGNNLLFELRYRDLTSPLIGAHIHGPANSTNTAGVIIDLGPYAIGAGGTNGAFAGSIPLTPAQKTMILDGLTYMNIHTINNGGGEIRGQIGTVLMSTSMNGANENPDVPTAGIGTGTLLLVGDRLTFDMTYRNLTGTASDAHIHGPAVLEQGAGVLVPLGAFNSGPFGVAMSGSLVGSLTLSPAHLGYIIDGLTYVNIHSSFRSGGEIRGQIVR